ncbi:hypothetical protein O6H91_04G055100 [Diphasiastrum complanatum]|nr:hypothetical protein O6H91_04G055100 [Diphasiastrum complanatum]
MTCKCCMKRMDGKGKSFIRRTLGSTGFVQAVGTKAGPNGTTLVSTGLSDLDKIIGGGIPLGGIIMIMEDIEAPHHLLLLRYFLAQGVVHGQPLLFASPLTSPKSFLGTLPGLTKGKDSKGNVDLQKSGQSADGLRIAWQYQRYLNEQKALETRRQRQQEIASQSWASGRLHASSLSPNLSSSVTSGSLEYTGTFDLRKSMDQAMLNAVNTVCFSLQGETDMAPLHGQCAAFVTTHSRSVQEVPNVGRIAMQSIYAPQSMHLFSEWKMLSFLAWLKGIIRTANVVGLVTFPASLLKPSVLVRLQHLADILLSVEAVSDDHKEMEAMLTDYQDISGLLHVHKLASINTQVPSFPEASTYSIKVSRRKEVVLEHLHLAPVDVYGKGSGNAGAAQVLCSTPANAPSSLDF